MTAATEPAKKAIVLAHGAWHGASCWSRVLPMVSEPAELSRTLLDLHPQASA